MLLASLGGYIAEAAVCRRPMPTPCACVPLHFSIASRAVSAAVEDSIHHALAKSLRLPWRSHSPTAQPGTVAEAAPGPTAQGRWREWKGALATADCSRCNHPPSARCILCSDQ